MEGLFIIGISSALVLRAIPGTLEGNKPFEGKNINPSLYPRLLHDLGKIFYTKLFMYSQAQI